MLKRAIEHHQTHLPGDAESNKTAADIAKMIAKVKAIKNETLGPDIQSSAHES